MGVLRILLLINAISYIVLWPLVILQLVPREFAFLDHTNPLLVNWNWSFMPLNLLMAATGLGSIYLYQRKQATWQSLALVTLVLTFCAGLQATAFLLFQGTYDPSWLLPNLYLLIFPLFFIPKFIRLGGEAATTSKASAINQPGITRQLP